MISKKKALAGLLATISIIVLFSQTPALAEKFPSESWMGMYFGRSKIGFAKFVTDQAKYQGRPGYRIDSVMSTHMLVLGIDVDQDVDTTMYLDKKFTPVYQLFKMSSAGHTTTVTAVYSSNQIVAELDAGGAKTSKTIPIPPGSNIIGDEFLPSSKMALKVGDKLDMKTFNPLTLTLDDVHSEVIREESIVVGGKSYDSFIVRSATSLGEITSWQDKDGDVLKAIGPLEITMIREHKEVAMAVTAPGEKEYVPPTDLAIIAAPSVNADIANPREARYLSVRFTGLADKSLAISDTRQKVTLSGQGPFTADYEITASRLDPSKTATLPIKMADQSEFLGESAYVQPANPEITALAKQIVGDEKNSGRIVALLRAWVNGNMSANGDIGIVRSSLDVLHTKTGVCRDYAILYTALARAAGVPTKVISGLVFWKGKFYFHAWAESFVGEWIPVDATLSTDFVDATHIKFAEGDATTMFTIVKLMGYIKADIVKFD